MDHSEDNMVEAAAGAPTQFRSLEELADSDEFRKFLDDEFPHRATLLEANLDRRQFLTLMGASLSLAGLAGCGKLPGMPEERIVPAVRAPEEYVPGKPLNYASAMPFKGYGLGVLVESHEGRPTKIEGNDLHPATLGSSNVHMQASLLELYDPDRSKSVSHLGQSGTWDELLNTARTALDGLRGAGEGLRILTETVTSPTLADQIAQIQKAYPGAVWHQYDALGRDNTYAGAVAAFGAPANPVYHFDRADVILSLDCDFLSDLPGSIVYARQFIDRRRVRLGRAEMNRLYAAETMPTITGAMAEHRFLVKPSGVEQFARAVASRLGVGGAAGTEGVGGVDEAHLNALIQDLQGARGRSLVTVGEQQPAVVHAIAHAINQSLGNIGATVTFTDPIETHPVEGVASLQKLVEDCNGGRVKVLIVLGGNPVLTAPADIPVADAFSKVPFSARLGLYEDETSGASQWHIPETHFLEAWGDIRGFDGTASIIQPLIQPLYEGRSAHELLAGILIQPLRAYEIVREYWRKQQPGADFESRWRTWLNDGIIPETAAQAKTVAANPGPLPAPGPAAVEGLEINVRPDPNVLDGRYSNNNWLQELPKPLTKLVWDNAAIMSGATAVRLGYGSEARPDKAVGQMIELDVNGRKATLPISIIPGHAHDCVTVHMGYGRTELGGSIANEKGFNVHQLRTAAAPWFSGGLKVSRGRGTYELVTTHYHNSMDMQGRDPIVVKTLEQFKTEPHKLRKLVSEYKAITKQDSQPPSIQGALPKPQEPGVDSPMQVYETPEDFRNYDGYQWGMSIDNNACIGCNACVIACQAENNIPVVGKQQVSVGREMHWLRVDRYYDKVTAAKGNVLPLMENPKTFFQPVPCMHCEKAPCEPVCPVSATVHSHEGLNQMVYNRCVGTRYCSNNCPYKVRRFNFLNYANDHTKPVLKLVSNPNVTVRGRGVMEKCTYCVQRINAARIDAKKRGTPIKDGEVVTACQQACPTKAIIFGDLADENSEVRKVKREPQDYSLLADLNVRPRTTYLPKLRNPNTTIEKPVVAEEAGH